MLNSHITDSYDGDKSLDYAIQPIRFKIRKILRYLRLYGPSRTVAKVRGQLHIRKRYPALPAVVPGRSKGKHVAMIGCGNYAYATIAFYLKRNYGAVIRGCMDADINKAASLFESYSVDYYTSNAEDILSDSAIDLVFVASNHASHAEYAIRALEAGKSVHIEKPHVVSEDQLVRLCDAMHRSSGKVQLGFNRPGSRFGAAILEALLSQAGSAVFNWFIAGHAIEPDHWYYRPEEGGRVLGNLCHWTDFVYQMTPPEHRYPLTIKPTRSVRSDCDIAVNYIFGDGSIAAITFSAKGHTFEGVRERFAAHRGNILISMDDFQCLSIENVARKQITKALFRDHGHQEMICRAYRMVRPANKESEGIGQSISYVWETGDLFLKTRQALEENREIVVQPYKERFIQQTA